MKRLTACCLATAAALLLGACQDAPTSPAAKRAPIAPALSALPSGAVPYNYPSPPFTIVDQNDDLVWQDLSQATLYGPNSPFTATGGYFTFSVATTTEGFRPCVPILGTGTAYYWSCDYFNPEQAWMVWDQFLLGSPRGCIGTAYPIGMWYWFNDFSCESFGYNQQLNLILEGTRFRAVAAPTAPGGLVFRRWEIRIQNEVQPCAEGLNSPTCTITAVKDYRPPSTFPDGYIPPGPYFKLVYEPYSFSGFFSPVDNTPTLNSVKAGSAVPLRFSLGADRGLNVFAAGSPTSQPIPCSTSAVVDAIEQTVTAGNSSLSYDAKTDTYTYVWKTDKSFAGTCRAFSFVLLDGSTHTANFQFTK